MTRKAGKNNMDIVKAYEAYCDFIDMIADEDVLASIGLEGVGNDEKATASSKKEEKKRTGLIGALSALINGIIEFFTTLLGIEKGQKDSGKIEMIAPPEAPTLNIQQIEAELMRNINTLAKTSRTSPEFKVLTKKCEDLLKDFRDRADDVAVAARKYAEKYGDKPIVGGKVYEANIGMTKKKLNSVKKAAQQSEVANREVVRYVSEFINTVKAIANSTQIDNVEKHKEWSDRKADKALGKANDAAENALVKASKRSAQFEGAKA